jgi:ribosome-binding factor A
MHLSNDYRNAKIYSSLFRDAQATAQANNCEKIQTSDQSIQWDPASKLNLLHGQKYNQIDISWEKKIDE